MRTKYIIYTAKFMSLLFAPFYFCLLSFIIMLIFSYMRLLPVNFKLLIVAIVYFFTIALPMLGISVYRKLCGLRRHQMTRREMRYVPYLISIVSYACCLLLMNSLHIPHFMISVLIGALLVSSVCAIINHWVHISTHAAAAGAMNGALLSFSFIFNFNPLWWLCLTVLICGLVASSRIILRQHNLREVGLGVLVGFISGLIIIFLI